MRDTLPLALLLCLVPGCLELETAITLNADGSGTQAMRLSMSQAAIAAVRSSAAAVEASASANPLEAFEADKVRAELEAAGLQVSSCAATLDRGRRCVAAEARFPDLATLAKSPLSGGSKATWRFLRGPRRDEVRLVFYPQGHDAWKDARVRAAELAKAPDEVAARFFAARKRELAGLKVVLALELPGDVVAHTANLALVSPRRVRATLTADDVG
jgi:hypothetical protein